MRLYYSQTEKIHFTTGKKRSVRPYCGTVLLEKTSQHNWLAVPLFNQDDCLNIILSSHIHKQKITFIYSSCCGQTYANFPILNVKISGLIHY